MYKLTYFSFLAFYDMLIYTSFTLLKNIEKNNLENEILRIAEIEKSLYFCLYFISIIIFKRHRIFILFNYNYCGMQNKGIIAK